MTRIFGIDTLFQDINLKLIRNIFNNINQTTVEIGAELGKTPKDFNPQVYNILKSFSENVVLPVAVYFVAIIITLNLIRNLLDDMKRQNPIKLFIMFAITSVIAIMLVTNSFEIVEEILNLTQTVVNKALDLLNLNNNTNLVGNFQQFEETLKELSFGSLFSLTLTLIFTFFITWIIRILVQVVILGRFIEIFMRISISPIPFATFFNREFSSSGYNFVKSMGAVSLQAVLIMVVIAIYKGLVANILVSIGTEEELNLFLIKTLGINITLIFSLFQTKRISDSILQAH